MALLSLPSSEVWLQQTRAFQVHQLAQKELLAFVKRILEWVAVE